MKLVYIEQHLSDLAPSVIGAFCVDPSAEWVTFTDITAALERGESVTIRPASATEKTRVESLIALSAIADQLAAKVGGLLDSPARSAHAEWGGAGWAPQRVTPVYMVSGGQYAEQPLLREGVAGVAS